MMIFGIGKRAEKAVQVLKRNAKEEVEDTRAAQSLWVTRYALP